MTSPSNSPTSTNGTGDNRPRRSRGARGRGGRPGGEQSHQNQPRVQATPSAVPAPVVVPVGADATVLPTDTPVERVATDAGFGTPASLRQHLHAAIGVAPLTYRRTFRGEAAHPM